MGFDSQEEKSLWWSRKVFVLCYLDLPFGVPESSGGAPACEEIRPIFSLAGVSPASAEGYQKPPEIFGRIFFPFSPPAQPFPGSEHFAESSEDDRRKCRPAQMRMGMMM
jgi:hypothetical protein